MKNAIKRAACFDAIVMSMIAGSMPAALGIYYATTTGNDWYLLLCGILIITCPLTRRLIDFFVKKTRTATHKTEE